MKTGPLKKQKIADIGHIPQMNTHSITKILGDNTPELEPNAVGKYRLQQALQNKFGDNYAQHPQAKLAMSKFEVEKEYVRTLAKMRLRFKNGTNG